MELLPYIIYSVVVSQFNIHHASGQKDDGDRERVDKRMGVNFTSGSNDEFTTTGTEDNALAEATEVPDALNETLLSFFDLNDTNETGADVGIDTSNGEDEYDNASRTTLIPPLLMNAPDVPPSLPPEGDLEKELGVEDFCLCDLKVDVCDVNCCCDGDCDEDDREVFSHCTERPQPVLDNKYCFQERLLFSNHTEYSVAFNHPGAFCIITDNLPKRTTYSLVKGATNLEEFDDLQKRRRTRRSFSWLSSEGATPGAALEPYRDGSHLWAIDKEGASFTLDMPTSVVGSECETTTPVLFLRDAESSCFRVLQDLTSDCQSNFHLDAHRYLAFSIIADPGTIFQNDTIETTVGPEIPVSTTATTTTSESLTEKTTSDDADSESVETTPQTPNESNRGSNDTQGALRPDRLSSPPGGGMEAESDFSKLFPDKVLAIHPYLCRLEDGNEVCSEKRLEDLPHPTYESGECNNVLLGATYVFLHNGSEGIYDVQAKIYLANLTDRWSQTRQTFSVKYLWASSGKMTTERSGRPGYIRGKPLLMGRILENGTDIEGEGILKAAVSLSTDPSHWLRILSPGRQGQCDTFSGVTFGLDLAAGCLLQVTPEDFSRDCEHLQGRILRRLLGGGSIPLDDGRARVASYGDSNVNNPADWVPVLVAEEPQCVASNVFLGPNTRGRVYNLITSLHIEVAYSMQGSLANPQSKVVGVRIRYGEPQEIRQPCFLTPHLCPSGSGERTTTRAVELRSSVSFVDVSRPPLPAYSQPPALDVKLPHDFFYPFLPSSSSSFTCPDTVCFIVCAFILQLIKQM